MDSTSSTSLTVKADFDVLNSPEKDDQFRVNGNFDEVMVGGSASGEYLHGRSASPLRSDFCSQICRIFDESDNKETDADLGCSSFFLSDDRHPPNETEEEAMQSSFLHSVVNDLLSQQPAQLDVLVSSTEKQNEVERTKAAQPNTRRLCKSTTGANENNRSVESDENDLRHQSEPPFLIKETLPYHTQPSSVDASRHSLAEAAKELNCWGDEIIEIANGKDVSDTPSCNDTLLLNGQPNDALNNKTKRQNPPRANRSDEKNTTERCAFDPVTKRRFYEPHKRSGCGGVYCLSQITQIGERICGMENKLATLSELLKELVENDGVSDDGPSENRSQMRRQLHQHIVRSANALKVQQQQRVGGSPPLRCPPSRNAAQTNGIHLPANSSLASPFNAASSFQNKLPYPTFYQQRSRLGHGTQSNTVTVPSKLLDYGVTICRNCFVFPVFPESETMKNAVANATVCPVCFAKFEPFSNLYAHLLRHSDKKLRVDFYCCKLCKATNAVHFLSVPAVREHIRNAHGVANDAALKIEYSDPRGSLRMIQNMLQSFVHAQIDEWRSMGSVMKKLLLLKQNRFHQFTQSLGKRRKEAQGEEEDVIDQILFSPSEMPKNLSERFKRLKKVWIDRVPSDQLVVPICDKSFVGVCSKLIATMAKHCAKAANG